jgi:hypothetical protein
MNMQKPLQTIRWNNNFSIFINILNLLSMKKKSVFLACALAIMLCAGCGETVELTDIAVLKNSISLSVGKEILIVTRTAPENADSQTFTFTSNDESVAKVSSTGVVTITGVGTAVITVTNGSYSQTVTITGTLNDIVLTPANLPLFTQVGVTSQLSAMPDPAVPVTFIWTSEDPAIATVSENGLVEITGEGTTKIIVSGGNVTKEVLVSVGVPLVAKSNGWWTFDDPANLAKATIGSDLVFEKRADASGPVIPADGPTADNGAAFVPRSAWMKCLHGIAANGPSDAKRVNEFTIMFDVMLPVAKDYHALIQAYVDNKGEASMYLKSNGRIGGGGMAGSPDGTTKDNTWYRVIVIAKLGDGGYYNYYLIGKDIEPLLITNGDQGKDNGRHSLDPAGVLFFSDGLPGDGGDGSLDDNDLYVAEIAIWDRALSAAEVALIGMFEIDSNE